MGMRLACPLAEVETREPSVQESRHKLFAWNDAHDVIVESRLAREDSFLLVAIAAPTFGKMIVPAGCALALSNESVFRETALLWLIMKLSFPGRFMSLTL